MSQAKIVECIKLLQKVEMSQDENNAMSEEDQRVASEESSLEQIREEVVQQEKLIVQQEPNDKRCATYIFNHEDHTLGNILRTILSGHAEVEFVGYSIPHPSESKMNLRIQTTSVDTNQVLNETFKTVQNITRSLRDKFNASLIQKK